MKDKRQRLQPNNKSKDEDIQRSDDETELSEELKDRESEEEPNQKDSDENKVVDEGNEDHLHLTDETERKNLPQQDERNISSDNGLSEVTAEDKATVIIDENNQKMFDSTSVTAHSIHEEATFYSNKQNEACKEHLGSNKESTDANHMMVSSDSNSIPQQKSTNFHNSNNNHFSELSFTSSESDASKQALTFKENSAIHQSENPTVSSYQQNSQLKNAKDNESNEEKWFDLHRATATGHPSSNVTDFHDQNFNFLDAQPQQTANSNPDSSKAQSAVFSNDSALKIQNGPVSNFSTTETVIATDQLPKCNSNNTVYEVSKAPIYPVPKKALNYNDVANQQQPQAFSSNPRIPLPRNASIQQLSFESKRLKGQSHRHTHPDYSRFNSYPSHNRPLVSTGYNDDKHRSLFEPAYYKANSYEGNPLYQPLDPYSSKQGFSEGQATVGYLPAPNPYQNHLTTSAAAKEDHSANNTNFISETKQTFHQDSSSVIPSSKTHITFNNTLPESRIDSLPNQCVTDNSRSALYVQPITPPSEPGPTVFTQSHTPLTPKSFRGGFDFKPAANHATAFSTSLSTSSIQTSGLLNDVQKILDPSLLHL